MALKSKIAVKPTLAPESKNFITEVTETPVTGNQSIPQPDSKEEAASLLQAWLHIWQKSGEDGVSKEEASDVINRSNQWLGHYNKS